MASRALVKHSQTRKIASSPASTAVSRGPPLGVPGAVGAGFSPFGMLSVFDTSFPSSFGMPGAVGAGSSSDTDLARSICGIDQSADVAACFGAGGKSYSIEARSPEELGLPRGLTSMTKVITHYSSATGKTAHITVKVERSSTGGVCGTAYGYVADKAPSNAPKWVKKALGHWTAGWSDGTLNHHRHRVRNNSDDSHLAGLKTAVRPVSHRFWIRSKNITRSRLAGLKTAVGPVSHRFWMRSKNTARSRLSGLKTDVGPVSLPRMRGVRIRIHIMEIWILDSFL